MDSPGLTLREAQQGPLTSGTALWSGKPADTEPGPYVTPPAVTSSKDTGHLLGDRNFIKHVLESQAASLSSLKCPSPVATLVPASREAGR